jgi:hypothetical protein
MSLVSIPFSQTRRAIIMNNKTESASNSQQFDLTEQERELLWQAAMEKNPEVPYYDIWKLPATIIEANGL